MPATAKTAPKAAKAPKGTKPVAGKGKAMPALAMPPAFL
jgi:hypothetical protein